MVCKLDILITISKNSFPEYCHGSHNFYCVVYMPELHVIPSVTGTMQVGVVSCIVIVKQDFPLVHYIFQKSLTAACHTPLKEKECV